MRQPKILMLCLFMNPLVVTAQEPATDTVSATDKKFDLEKLSNDFQELMNKSVMVGTFTVDKDQDQKRLDERYEISRIVKLPKGDYWNFLARIKYGSHNVMLPVPVEVKWAGDTPVITVDNLELVGLGTFDARVVISDNKYAGTWRHGEVGGLMFGHIEKQPAKPDQEGSVNEGTVNPQSDDQP